MARIANAKPVVLNVTEWAATATIPGVRTEFLSSVGCFRVGSQVVRGNGTKVMMITSIERVTVTTFDGKVTRKDPMIRLNRGVPYSPAELSLAG